MTVFNTKSYLVIIALGNKALKGPTVQVMIEITGVLQKQAWDRNIMPPIEKVRPGLWSVPVPIPANPLRYVLVYVLELDNGFAIIDAGWNTDVAWHALNAGLAEVGGSITDVKAVLVTHMHPDHYGLAGRVREASGAWVGLHPADAAILEGRYVNTDELLRQMWDLLVDCGVPDNRLSDLNLASMMIRSQVSVAQPDVLFSDGDMVDLPGWDLRAIWTPGHSPGHTCFYSERYKFLLSGDHILPHITPNITVHTQSHPNPVGEYLASLKKIEDIVAEEVMPAHEYRFSGLKERIKELADHHSERLAEVAQLLAERPGATAWDLTILLTWSRPWAEIPPFMQRAALGETLAHLVELEEEGHVRREGSHPFRFFTVSQYRNH